MRTLTAISGLAPRRDDSMLRAMSALTVGCVRPGGTEAALVAMFGDDPKASAVLKAVQDPLTTANAPEILQTALAAFIANLQPQSAAAALFARATRVDFGSSGRLFLPTVTGAVAAWVSEAEPIPVSEAAFGSAEISLHKIGALAVLSEEVAKRSTAQVAVELALNQAVAKALDETAFDAEAESAERPAGLLNGVAALPGMPGGDATAMQADLAALIGAVAAVAGGGVVLVAHPLQALQLQLLAPGLTIPILQSGHIAPGLLIAIAPDAVTSATGEMDFAVSREVALHMSAPALEIVSDTGPTVAAPVRDVWQTNCVALRALLDLTWRVRGSGAVAFFENTSW